MCSSCSVLEHKEHKHILLSESFICFLVEKNMGMNGVMRATQETKTSHQRAKRWTSERFRLLKSAVCLHQELIAQKLSPLHMALK